MANYFSDWTTFVWAVLNNWAGYATGGLIVALVTTWWNVLRDKPIPRRVLIVLTVVFLVLGIFNAWRTQHRRVIELTNKSARPEFFVNKSQIMTVEGVNNKTGEKLSRYAIEIGLQTTREHAATRIKGYLVVLDSKTGSQIDRQDINKANDVGQNEPFYLYSNFLTFPDEGEPMFVFCDLKYFDASVPNAGEFEQAWYFHTSNFTKGWFLDNLYDAGPEKKEKIKTYLSRYGIKAPDGH